MLILNCKSRFHKLLNLFDDKTVKNIILTGGTSVIQIYDFLNKNNFFIKNKNIFLSDERIIFNYDDYKYTNSYLLQNQLRLKIKKFHSFYFNKRFRPQYYFSYFRSNYNVDLLVLSYAEDGHIASIFDFQKREKKNIVYTSSKHHKFKRITISTKLISNVKKTILIIQNQKRFDHFKKNHLNNNQHSLLKILKNLNIIKLYE